MTFEDLVLNKMGLSVSLELVLIGYGLERSSEAILHQKAEENIVISLKCTSAMEFNLSNLKQMVEKNAPIGEEALKFIKKETPIIKITSKVENGMAMFYISDVYEKSACKTFLLRDRKNVDTKDERLKQEPLKMGDIISIESVPKDVANRREPKYIHIGVVFKG